MDSETGQIKADFERYLFDEAGITSRGPVSTYIHALDVLCSAMEKTPGALPCSSNVWAIETPSDLMELHKFVIEQQHAYMANKTGIFSRLHSVGSCYFKNRFCSAAVKQLAAYRQTRRYEAGLQGAFETARSGTEVAKKAKDAKIGVPACFVPERINPASKEGKDAIITARRRINQSVFRRWIVGLYGNECCVTGLDIPDVLQASHIVSWASDSQNRMNPSNGLCLSATYHAAFDRHLISFDDDYRMVLSNRIRDYCSREVCANYFLKFEGTRIHLPSRFLPDRALLARHRGKLVS